MKFIVQSLVNAKWEDAAEFPTLSDAQAACSSTQRIITDDFKKWSEDRAAGKREEPVEKKLKVFKTKASSDSEVVTNTP